MMKLLLQVAFLVAVIVAACDGAPRPEEFKDPGVDTTSVDTFFNTLKKKVEESDMAASFNKFLDSNREMLSNFGTKLKDADDKTGVSKSMQEVRTAIDSFFKDAGSKASELSDTLKKKFESAAENTNAKGN